MPAGHQAIAPVVTPPPCWLILYNRHGVTLATTECYWPGCGVPTSSCHIDHLRPAARGGPTRQRNGLPACPRHNRLKERGYTVHRHQDGTLTITTPTGDTVQ